MTTPSALAPVRRPKTFIAEIRLDSGDQGDGTNDSGEVRLAGWVLRLRALAKTTFIVLQDTSGTVQCVTGTESLRGTALKLDDAVEIIGRVRPDARSRSGFEIDVISLRVVAESGHRLPFHASSDLSEIGQETVLDYRPLSLRNEKIGDIFRLQAEVVQGFRRHLSSRRFTEIFSSKIVAGGTEGGTNLFEIKYFERAAYLAQSPQFFKEHGVCGLERVFETGHVYRAEPHASSRHLTEYYSLDLEMGFIDGAEEIIALERELLSAMFADINRDFADALERHGQPMLPEMMRAPTWEFGECLDRLRVAHGSTHLVDDLDPQAERELCVLAEQETGIPAVFVLGFPLGARPFYSHPREASGYTKLPAAQSFDLLFRGLEITTGGQRLHRRADLEAALRAKGMDPASFEEHLRMFELGMPPHGGLAIGAERLTAQILGLPNVRQATLYPRDRYHISP